jgi:hypothetical protein
MNTSTPAPQGQLPPAIRAALSPFAPPQSSVQFSEAELLAADIAYNVDKAGKAHRLQERNAMRLQLQHASRDYL